jgi:hypothetical protein
LTWVMSYFRIFSENASMEQFTIPQKKDLKILISFVRVYCGAKHEAEARVDVGLKEISGRETLLCRECAEVLEHALEKRRICPLKPKPSCRNCHIHCYGKDYRARIREIMAFSGRRMILRGRLDYLRHYLF